MNDLVSELIFELGKSGFDNLRLRTEKKFEYIRFPYKERLVKIEVDTEKPESFQITLFPDIYSGSDTQRILVQYENQIKLRNSGEYRGYVWALHKDSSLFPLIALKTAPISQNPGIIKTRIEAMDKEMTYVINIILETHQSLLKKFSVKL